MAKRTFKVINEEYDWQCEIAIDEEKAMSDIIEMVEFWSGWQTRLEENQGDYVKTFLKQLARELLRLAIKLDYDKDQAIEYFNAGAEGWTKMDGSEGIEIINMDPFYISDDDEEFIIHEIPF